MDRIQKIQAAKKGDRSALVSLIMENKDDYYRLAYVLTGNPHDAGDALEDMIVILFEKMYQLRDAEAFPAWSRTILRNCCRQIQRRQRRVVPLEDIPEEAQAGDPALDTVESMVLQTSLQQLDPLHREVIRLRYYLDYDYRTIADVLRIPVGTVRSRLANGLKKMKTILGGEGYVPCGRETR